MSTQGPKYAPLTSQELQTAIQEESEEFSRALHWLEGHMPSSFLEETDPATRRLIARHLLSFAWQDRFAIVRIRDIGIVLCLDAPDADLKILKQFSDAAIRYYRAFVSKEAPPGEKEGKLRIALLFFADVIEGERLDAAQTKELLDCVEEVQAGEKRDAAFEGTLAHLPPRFIRSLTGDRLKTALRLLFRARTQDRCQYDMKRNESWSSRGGPSLQLVLAWRNVPKEGFLYRLARIIDEHKLALQKVVATYIDPYSPDNLLILSLGLHGGQGGAAWEEADLDDFIRELCLLKHFEAEDLVSQTFVQPRLVSGNEGHLIRCMSAFVHQTLVYADPNLYSPEHVLEGLCRHPELTISLCRLFEQKFDPEAHDISSYQKQRQEFLKRLELLDTGQAYNDFRRRNILRAALSFLDHILKTNFYRPNKSAFSFRLDPRYLAELPYDRSLLFPELPYGLFFLYSSHLLGFHIRFKDLARGGVRTVIPAKMETYQNECNNIFSEAYNLAYTQQKKNKDIPEGGSKMAVLLKPFEIFSKEEKIYRRELLLAGFDPAILEEKVKIFQREHKLAFLFTCQRAFIESLVTLLNCEEDGALKATHIVDYWKKPEYIYLGPDENMYNDMIVWISNYAVEKGYKPGRSFMTSKPGAGINHKEFGVTSYGVHVYLHQTLLALGINPEKEAFTIKISGGPDGDVAGNEIVNLHRFYPKTAKLLALTDVSGTIYDPKGLDLNEMVSLFKNGLPIRNYPPDALNEGGFLLDLHTRREETEFAWQTLLWKKGAKGVEKLWLSGSEMNQLYRSNLHQVPATVFVPAGGRPKTLNDSNWMSYLDAEGKPTSRAIVEGANLYLTFEARRALEKLGVLIIKDSSCNKGGVICSSLEVLGGLVLTEEEFLREKSRYVQEILAFIAKAAEREAKLLLSTHEKTGAFLTDVSEKISERINLYKYQILDALEKETLPASPKDPLLRCLFLYCPPLLREKYTAQILALPPIHQKAIIACSLASYLVYTRGLEWGPQISDLLASLAKSIQDPYSQ